MIDERQWREHFAVPTDDEMIAIGVQQALKERNAIVLKERSERAEGRAKRIGVPPCIALIPARSGSKRIPGKNVKVLAGHPIMAYTIAAARESGIFSAIVVSTDSERYRKIAMHYGADEVVDRPRQFATDNSPDIDWLYHALVHMSFAVNAFSILRVDSPFRQAETIRRAWRVFQDHQPTHSLRAVQCCRRHPGKMWRVTGKYMVPLLSFERDGTPWHSNQSQTLPTVYEQNSSLEIAWVSTVMELGSIAGELIVPFYTTGYEGFDVNTETEWLFAEWLVETGEAVLPMMESEPWKD